jgi:bacteriocin biosynthesis cyclodehydratase domain-containing protein
MSPADAPIRLRETVEAFPATDGRLYFLRGGTDADFVVDEPSALDRDVVELLHAPADIAQLRSALAERGHDCAPGEVEALVGELEALHLAERLGPADDTGLNAATRERFDRQLAYFADVVGPGPSASGAQRRLLEATVVIVGCGGLGSWVAAGLACAGVGRLVLVDDDTVALSNLNRQLLFRHADVGRPKVHAAAEALRAFNPDLEVAAHHRRVASARDVEELAGGAQLVVGVADQPPYDITDWINRGCFAAGVPSVSAAQFPPNVRVGPLVRPGVTGCTECQTHAARRAFPEYDALVAYRKRRFGAAATLGPLSGLVGSTVSMDAVHLITGIETPATEGRAITIDARDLSTTSEPVEVDPDCPLCNPRS